MRIFVRPIIKIIDNGLKIISENKTLPEFELSDNVQVDTQIIKFLGEKYYMLESICQPKLLNCVILNQELVLYYTLFYPKDYIDEKIALKVSNIHNEFSEQDQNEIRQAIQIYPY